MRRVLGKGLAQLLGEQEEAAAREVPIECIEPNPRQPRRGFAQESLEELAESIRRIGLVQPVVVRPLEMGRYELIAGERRWRAAKLAGLEKVPVVVRSADGAESLQIALIENLQREDITPLEAAEGYQSLISELGLTQEELSRRVGKSRSAVANALRLLRLPETIRRSLASGEITEGHARALLQLETEAEQLFAHARIVEKGLSVREAERIASGSKARKAEGRNEEPPSSDTALEAAIGQLLGSPVRIRRSGARGRIEIEFFSDEDLGRILETLKIRL